jgi:hypothetical protein
MRRQESATRIAVQPIPGWKGNLWVAELSNSHIEQILSERQLPFPEETKTHHVFGETPRHTFPEKNVRLVPHPQGFRPSEPSGWGIIDDDAYIAENLASGPVSREVWEDDLNVLSFSTGSIDSFRISRNVLDLIRARNHHLDGKVDAFRRLLLPALKSWHVEEICEVLESIPGPLQGLQRRDLVPLLKAPSIEKSRARQLLVRLGDSPEPQAPSL